MIKVIAKSIVKESEIQNYLECVKIMVAETRKEEGCIVYELYQDINNEKIFTIIEEWESLDALDLHKKSKHMSEIIPKINLYRESVEVIISKKVI